MADTLKRKLTFSAWADAVQNQQFDPVATTAALAAIPADEQVLSHDDSLTAVEVLGDGDGNKPVRLRLLALHDAANAPSARGPLSAHDGEAVRLGGFAWSHEVWRYVAGSGTGSGQGTGFAEGGSR